MRDWIHWLWQQWEWEGDLSPELTREVVRAEEALLAAAWAASWLSIWSRMTPSSSLAMSWPSST